MFRGERMKYSQNREARFDDIFNLLHQDIPAEEIAQRLSQAEAQKKQTSVTTQRSRLFQVDRSRSAEISKKIGLRSESVVDSVLLSMTHLVQHVVPATPEEDARGIDRFVSFIPETGHPLKVVQIKSSYRGVEKFLRDPKYVNLCEEYNGGVIIINAGPRIVTQATVADQFLKQLEKIDGFI